MFNIDVTLLKVATNFFIFTDIKNYLAQHCQKDSLSFSFICFTVRDIP